MYTETALPKCHSQWAAMLTTTETEMYLLYTLSMKS